MRPFLTAALLAAALALSACVSGAPLSLADDNPASPKAASGPVDIPTAFAGYKPAADLAAQTTSDTKAPSGDHAGMEHGAMPGMHHGGATEGAGER
jgi:uncharacterized protein involved in copper resistance